MPLRDVLASKGACSARFSGASKIKTGPQGPAEVSSKRFSAYLILDSLNSTCLRATGSYFFLTSLSVMVREFFLAT
jgi:hypothetical protein